MQATSKKPSKTFIIIMSLIAAPFVLYYIVVTLFLSAQWVTRHVVERKYYNKDFVAYDQRYRECASYYGGSHETRDEVYKHWQAKDSIPC